MRSLLFQYYELTFLKEHRIALVHALGILSKTTDQAQSFISLLTLLIIDSSDMIPQQPSFNSLTLPRSRLPV